MQPNLNDKIQQAKAAGYSDTEIQGYLQQTGFRPPAPAPSGQLRVSTPYIQSTSATQKPKGRGGTLTSLISEATGTGGAMGGASLGSAIGTAVLPGAGTIIGGVLGGLIGGFGAGTAGRALENKVRDDEYRIKQALGEGVISGVSGAVGGAVKGVQAAKALKGVAEAGRLTQAGIQQQLSALGVKGSGSPLSAVENKTLLQALKQVPGASATAKLQNMPSVIANKNAELANILAKSTETTSKKTVYDLVKTKAASLSQFLEADPTYQKALTSELTDLGTKLQGTKVTAAAVQSAKNNLSAKMTGIFDKVSRAVDLNPKEAARLAVWQGLDDTIIKLSPEAKNATLFLSNLRTAAPNIVKASEKTLGVPLLGIKSRGAEQASQALRTTLGATAERVGGLTQRVPTGVTPILLGQAIGGAGRALETPVQTTTPSTLQQALSQTALPSTVATTTSTVGTNPFTPELLITAIASDPKNAALYERIYKIYEDKYKTTTSTKPLTEQQQARQDVNLLATDALNRLRTGNIKTGAIAGRLEQYKGVVGKADQATLEFNTIISNLLGTIAKARGGTSFTPNEQRLLQQYAPKIGDSRQQLETKLNALLNQFGTDTGTTVMSPQEQMLQLLTQQTGGTQ